MTEATDRGEAGASSPHLDEAEQQQAAAHAAPKALVIHEVIREEGEAELQRTVAQLAWSGLAAGMSMGFSLLTLAMLQASLPDTPWRHTVAAVGYSVGFIITILGRQQLFTETTLTAMLPLFVRRDAKTLAAVVKLWVVVLIANLVGTTIIAAVISASGVLETDVHQSMLDISNEIMGGAFISKMVKAMLAGWLIALMVWLLPSARSARFFVILLLTYIVALGRFPHIVAGSVEAAVAVFTGGASVHQYLVNFLAPTLIGNTIGGVTLAALLNHAPVAGEISFQAGAEEAG